MKSRFLNSLRDEVRKKYYSLKTGQTCLQRVSRFIRYDQLRHPTGLHVMETVRLRYADVATTPTNPTSELFFEIIRSQDKAPWMVRERQQPRDGRLAGLTEDEFKKCRRHLQGNSSAD